MSSDTPQTGQLDSTTEASAEPARGQLAPAPDFSETSGAFLAPLDATERNQRTVLSMACEWLPQRPSVKRVRAELQRLDSLLVSTLKNSRDRAQTDHRLAQLARVRVEVIGLLENSKSHGGRARAASAIRRTDGTFIGHEEIGALILEEYERYARGGRARAARAARAFDGTFVSNEAARRGVENEL